MMSGNLLTGVDANYSLLMEQGGAEWKWSGRRYDLFKGMANHGISEFRVRVWTRDDGPHGRTYATEVVKRALGAGLNPYLVLFLSDDWADLMKQPIPAAWKGLSFKERAAAVCNYSRDTVQHFRKVGLRSHLYEIGNEIDYGICGVYPGKGAKKGPAALSKRVWPRTAELIKASQDGVLQADPDARFLIHIAHWWDAEFCTAFFRFMIEHGARVDYAGLSYFPSSNIGGSLEIEEFGIVVSQLAESMPLPVIVAETAYPRTREFKGQFARWKYDAPGYPLSSQGQRLWVRDFLTCCNHHPHIHSVYYWSPEWYGEGMWKAFALFDEDGRANEAWEAFAAGSWRSSKPLRSVYAEVSGGQLFVVPVQEARQEANVAIRALLQKTGGVTVEYINLLTHADLRIGAYAVNLRASLQNNLSLRLIPGSKGIRLAEESAAIPDGLTALAGELDTENNKLVLFVRDENTTELQLAISFFEERGITTYLHPLGDASALRWGLMQR